MSNVSIEDVVKIVEVIRGIETNEKAPSEEEKRRAEEAKRRAEEEKRQVEEQTASAEEQARQADEAQRQAEEEKRKVEAEIAERENRLIDRHLSASFDKDGFDKDVVESLIEFIDYDKLKNDKREADEEKISKFAELFNSVALRQPPKSGSRKSALTDDGGIAKYLQDK